MNDQDTIERALHGVDLPDYVVRRRAEIDIDSTGREAVWIWHIVRDGMSPSPEQLGPLRDASRRALKAAGVDLWPYFRIRTESEDEAIRRDEGAR